MARITKIVTAKKKAVQLAKKHGRPILISRCLFPGTKPFYEFSRQGATLGYWYDPRYLAEPDGTLTAVGKLVPEKKNPKRKNPKRKNPKCLVGPYDVLQIDINGAWKDYATIESKNEFYDAMRIWRDEPKTFRIKINGYVNGSPSGICKTPSEAAWSGTKTNPKRKKRVVKKRVVKVSHSPTYGKVKRKPGVYTSEQDVERAKWIGGEPWGKTSGHVLLMEYDRTQSKYKAEIQVGAYYRGSYLRGQRFYKTVAAARNAYRSLNSKAKLFRWAERNPM